MEKDNKNFSHTKKAAVPLDVPRQRGLEQMEAAPRARSVSFDKATNNLKIELINGVVFMIPTHLVQILKGATEEEIQDVELLLGGMYARWPRLDEDLKIQSLVEGTFGNVNWMREIRDHLSAIGRKGGSQKSDVKAEASRLNGAKGGRPKRSVSDHALPVRSGSARKTVSKPKTKV